MSRMGSREIGRRATGRREFLRDLGITATAGALVANLPSLGFAAEAVRKQRLVFMFSPNGVVPGSFWPEKVGEDFEFKEIVKPLVPFKDRTLFLEGIANKVGGDGDNHMRGMSCLLTGNALFPGNIQGGSDTPAGWSSGISIDQELKNVLQSRAETRTRFGSLEFGVVVARKADPWTRMVYAGPNRPIAPIDDPYRMFAKLYGRLEDRESLKSILDDVTEDLQRVRKLVSADDRGRLDDHMTFVREMEQDLQADKQQLTFRAPMFEGKLANENSNMPTLSKMQIDLLVNSFANDMARVATLQFTQSVGQARMDWLGVEEGHHSLSHEPDSNAEAQEKLIKINKWFCEQLAYLARRLDAIPEPGGNGTMLDNTTIAWVNELGKGNSHTLNDVPFVLVGGGLGFRMGRSLNFKGVAHNRLLLALANAMGHEITAFGKDGLSDGGPLSELT